MIVFLDQMGGPKKISGTFLILLPCLKTNIHLNFIKIIFMYVFAGSCIRSSWCIGERQTLEILDCDGDGLLDSVCFDFFGNIFATLLSTLDCVSTGVATGVTCQALEGNHTVVSNRVESVS